MKKELENEKEEEKGKKLKMIYKIYIQHNDMSVIVSFISRSPCGIVAPHYQFLVYLP